MKYQVYFVGNAGVLIKINNVTFLIDGFYSDEGTGFHVSPIPHCVKKDIFEEKGKLPNPDYIIFTHLHYDHFSGDILKEYLKIHHPKKVVLPEGNTIGYRECIALMKKRKISYEILPQLHGQYELENNVEITCFYTRHLGKQFLRTPHYCVYLNVFSTRLLVTSDMDFFTQELKSFWGKKLHGIFVNPLFYHNESGQNILKKIKYLDRIFVYHLPEEKEDKYHLQKMVKRDIKKYDNENKALFLTKPGKKYQIIVSSGGE
ncbi:MAG: MBL fold metallo-hydrolase [Anaerostipes sp.]|nr:MBL fold metallo-hydrolase [Anaerostipes sp.]